MNKKLEKAKEKIAKLTDQGEFEVLTGLIQDQISEIESNSGFDDLEKVELLTELMIMLARNQAGEELTVELVRLESLLSRIQDFSIPIVAKSYLNLGRELIEELPAEIAIDFLIPAVSQAKKQNLLVSLDGLAVLYLLAEAYYYDENYSESLELLNQLQAHSKTAQIADSDLLYQAQILKLKTLKHQQKLSDLSSEIKLAETMLSADRESARAAELSLAIAEAQNTIENHQSSIATLLQLKESLQTSSVERSLQSTIETKMASCLNLGIAYHAISETDKALEVFREGFELLLSLEDGLIDQEYSLIEQAQHRFIQILFEQGELEELTEFVEDIINDDDTLFDYDDDESALDYFNDYEQGTLSLQLYGHALQQLGRFEESEELFESLLSGVEEKFGEKSVAAFIAKYNLLITRKQLAGGSEELAELAELSREIQQAIETLTTLKQAIEQ